MIEENYINPDEALLQDKSRPRDEYWFKVRHWMNTEKVEFTTWVKNFYSDQLTAIWGSEIAGNLSWVPTPIPLWKWTSWYDNLPFSNYWLTYEYVKEVKWPSYTRWSTIWNYKDWCIVIPKTWTYIIKYYSEVFFAADQWTVEFMVALTNWKGWMYDYQSKTNASNPDNAGWMTIQDFKEWELLWLGGIHASSSWKKALYMWTIIIVRL